jgi:hypothetical protein
MIRIWILILLISNGMFCQDSDKWYSKKDKIIIPFDFSNNLIFLDVLVNNVKLKVILDTGTDNNILFSFPEKDSITFFNPIKTKISGVGNGIPIDAIISSGNNLKIEEFEINNFKILILNENKIDFVSKLGKEVNGIIGYTFFKDRLIEINYEKRKIVIYKEKSCLKKRKIKKKYKKNKIELINNKPYIKINSLLDNYSYSLKLLFDTGLSDGLWIFKNDSIKMPNVVLDDYLGYGLAGEIHGKRSRIDKLILSDFEFENVLVAFPDSSSFKNISVVDNRNGSIGGEIIKRFHVFIDYENENIYLRKSVFYNDSFNYNMSGLEVQHSGLELIKESIRLNSSNSEVNLTNIVKNKSEQNYSYKFILKPIYKIANVRNNSPAQKAGLLPNDKIVSINNKKAHNYTIQKITDLFQSEDGKKIKMEIEREDKIIEVEFYLKKII